jgi:hypothetical protein
MGNPRTFTPGAAIAAIVALVVVAVALAYALSGDDDGNPALPLEDGEQRTEPDTVPDPAPAEPSGFENAAVPLVDCRTLLTTDETDAAVNAWERADGAGAIEVSRGEVCSYEIISDPNHFVTISPGSPADFLPDAVVLGVPGEPVEGVQAEAVWFGGDAAEGGGDVGVLSARWGTSLGVLHFRIAVGRPDIDSATQREIAEALAVRAIPRFPGVEVLEPEPVVVTIDREEPNLASVSFADNLFAGIDAGEWTLEEGLVATLRVFVGEVDSSAVLGDTDLVDFSGTGTIQVALDYVENGPDEAARLEIAGLLDELAAPPALLDAAATDPSGEFDPGDADEAAPAPQSVQIAATAAPAGAVRLSILRQAVVAPAQEFDMPEEWCQSRFGIGAECMDEWVPPGLDGRKYSFYAPKPEADTGWDAGLIRSVSDGMAAAANAYEALTSASMPRVIIFLTEEQDTSLTTFAFIHHDPVACVIHLSPIMQQYDAPLLAQWIARDMAYCLIGETYPGQWTDGSGLTWWTDGLATYLSDTVQFDANLEHDNLPSRLESSELETTLLQRRFTNWAFFEHMAGSLGTEGILQRVGSTVNLDPAFEDQWHNFNEKLSDGIIDDVGSTQPGFDPPTDSAVLSGPTQITASPSLYGMARVQVEVAPAMKACVDYERTGGVTTSFRYGEVGPRSSVAWSSTLPPEIDRTGVFIVTATDPGRLVIDVKEVVDQEKECTPEEEEGGLGPCNVFCDDSGFYFTVPGYKVQLFEFP